MSVTPLLGERGHQRQRDLWSSVASHSSHLVRPRFREHVSKWNEKRNTVESNQGRHPVLISGPHAYIHMYVCTHLQNTHTPDTQISCMYRGCATELCYYLETVALLWALAQRWRVRGYHTSSSKVTLCTSNVAEAKCPLLSTRTGQSGVAALEPAHQDPLLCHLSLGR